MADELSPVILIAYANDRIDPANYLRDLVNESRIIRQLFEDKLSPQFRIEVRGNASLDDILRVFDRYEGRVVLFHFAGHAGELQLMLESDLGHPEIANMEGFTRLIANQQGLQLVFLNGCATFQTAEAIHTQGIPSVIATSEAINDHAALRFAERFYDRFTDNKSVEDAFQDAEIKVQTQLMPQGDYRAMYWEDQAENRFPWNLYSSAADWTLLSSINNEYQKVPAPPPAQTLYLLVDRDPQAEPFKDQLENLLSNQNEQPHFFFLLGPREEKHRSLVKRFRETDIRYNTERIYGALEGLVFTYDVRDWPVIGELEMRQRNLKRSIARSLDFPGITGGYWDQEVLLELLKERKGAITFQHNISGDKWDRETVQLIDWYIGDFWTFSSSAPFPQIMIFLNIIYPPKANSFFSNLFQRDFSKQIQPQLDQWRNKFTPRVTILNELAPITYNDVADWIDSYYPDKLTNLPNLLFGDDLEKTLPMEEVENALREEIARLGQEATKNAILGE